MISQNIKSRLQYLLPHHFLSRLTAKIANCKIPFIKDFLIGIFIKHYNIDLTIAIERDPKAYSSFNDFFIRALTPSARPIDMTSNSLVSPSDSTISQCGIIKAGQLFQAKGRTYSVDALLGGDSELSPHYQGGQFITLYLAPGDYHRVHMPLSGTLQKTIYVPGKLYSVNDWSVTNIDQLFCQNERLICFFDTEAGMMALILVGALLVAGIKTVWGEGTHRTKGGHTVTDFRSRNLYLPKGAEMGHFEFGSTVILLFGPEAVRFSSLVEAGQSVKMGEQLGTTCPAFQFEKVH